jgi:hypothetical protein
MLGGRMKPALAIVVACHSKFAPPQFPNFRSEEGLNTVTRRRVLHAAMAAQ